MSDIPYGDGPICVAVILCRDMIEDRRTNNRSLINVFNTITTNQLPSVQNRMVALISVTNALGDREFNITMRDPNGDTVLTVALPLSSEDPLATHDLALELMNVPLNLPGAYSVDVASDHRHLGSRRFTLDYQPS
jgi:hypothetical protein